MDLICNIHCGACLFKALQVDRYVTHVTEQEVVRPLRDSCFNYNQGGTTEFNPSSL